jgi:membrane protein involved in colicin uptake
LGVAPSKTASGAGTGALIGGAGGAIVGSNSSMGTGTGLLGGAAAGALVGGVVGMIQDAKDRKEQDRLAQERAYQQGLARQRQEEAKQKAAMEEELAIAQGFQISDLELAEAQKREAVANEQVKALREERAAAMAKKKALDDAHEHTLAAEAEIARLQEELARLKGEGTLKTASGGDAATAAGAAAAGATATAP